MLYLRITGRDPVLNKRYLVSAILGTLFCLVFFLVYDRFSHGVRSPYMTFLFLWPLVLELIPAAVLLFFPRIPAPAALTAVVWHSGTAALTAGSALRGVFDIAGNASEYQRSLMIFGFFMLALSLLSLIISIFLYYIFNNHRNN